MKLTLINLIGFSGSVAGFSTLMMTFNVPSPKSDIPTVANKLSAPSPGYKAWSNSVPSKAIPFSRAPGSLDGSMVGDVGFDPLGLSTSPIRPWFLNDAADGGNNEFAEDLKWYREAELIHGRIAQLAVLGFIVPGFITLPGNTSTGLDAYSYTNPLEAFSHVPRFALLQIFIFIGLLEINRMNIIKEDGEDYIPGDLRLGQGDNRFNPLGFKYTPEEYEEKQLQEIKHCRLAMLGVFGLWAQAEASGVGVVEQYANRFEYILLS